MKHDALNDALTKTAFEFFFWYSRFEAALKESGYVRARGKLARAEPDWDAFIEVWQDKYLASAQAQQLVKLAPKIQVVDQHGNLAWLGIPSDHRVSPLKEVVTMLQRVRNNLFHGGKKGADAWDDPRRTQELLEAARPILDELAELGAIEADFHQTY